ncbi:MAG: hypothetical protein ABIQ88_22365 [Chitinophagaceae bacterium]
MPPFPQHKNAFTTILTAWLLAGTLDISSALALFSIRTGKNPLLVFNYIASAVFGKPAYTAGTPMVVAGLLLHYLIALIFTVLLFLLYPRIHKMITNKFIIGILYGVLVWMIMNLLVVPLTRIPPFSISFAKAAENIVILILAIGLPVLLVVHRYYYGKEK